MQKYILLVSYWLGVVCAVLAIAMRISNALGFEFVHMSTRGNSIDFHSLLDAALLFLFVAIASSGYAIVKSQQGKL
jgi:hypothetical protein